MRGVGSAALITALFLAWTGTAESSKEQSFTDEERARLAAGRLVKRPRAEVRDGWNMIGGQAWQVIDAPPEAVWKAANDLPRYTEMVPGLSESNVTERRGRVAHVVLRHVYGAIDFSYPLRFEFRPEERIAVFRLDHSKKSDLRAGWGFVRVRPWKGGKTLLTFSALVDIGDGILVSIIRSAVRGYMLIIPRTAKQFIEGEGRPIYAP